MRIYIYIPALIRKNPKTKKLRRCLNENIEFVLHPIVLLF